MKKQWGQSQQSWQTSEKSRDESTTAQSLSFSVCVCVCVCEYECGSRPVSGDGLARRCPIPLSHSRALSAWEKGNTKSARHPHTFPPCDSRMKRGGEVEKEEEEEEEDEEKKKERWGVTAAAAASQYKTLRPLLTADVAVVFCCDCEARRSQTRVVTWPHLRHSTPQRANEWMN